MRVVALIAAVVSAVVVWGWIGGRSREPPRRRPHVIEHHAAPTWLDRLDGKQRAALRDAGGYGHWSRIRPRRRGIDEATGARLEALGYADAVAPAPDAVGVVRYDASQAWNGLNLYVAGHGPDATLMDMNGRVLHRWTFPMLRPRRAKPDLCPMRRAHAFEDGQLLALFDLYGLVKVDRDSRFEWAYTTPRPHHDFVVTPDGDIYVLTGAPRRVKAIGSGQVFDNDILRLDANGKELERTSILDALLAGPWPEMANEIRARMEPAIGDVLHTNSIQVLDGRFADRIPAFAKGNVLISCLPLHTVFVIDTRAKKAVWRLRGTFRYQHDARLLDTGRLLLFDNQRGAGRRSLVLEVDPATGRVPWSYGGPADPPIFSWCCGMARRLPNGNTLITETEAGRAFEVTADRTVVWDFVNPHRAGPDDKLIAQLYDVVRLPPEYGRDWLAPGG